MYSNSTKSTDAADQMQPSPVKAASQSFGPIKGSKTYSQPQSLLKLEESIEVYDKEKLVAVEKNKTSKDNVVVINVEKHQHKQTVADVDSNNKADYQIKSVYDFGSNTTSFYRYYPEIIEKEKQRLFSGKS